MIAKLKHFSPKETKNNKSLWHLIDATDKTLGRLASEISVILMGKNKVDYIPHQMSGDFVVIINSSNVKVTGKKLEQKTYITHSTRPGSTKEKKYSELLNNNPQYIISHAVKGMLPKNKLGAKMLTRLKVYPNSEHPHEAQLIWSEKINKS
ncbi:MAG: 50S ribosomal protein L13 [Chloroflexota bacterium]|jgi:large subunit ribosomal protein L13|nr:50S ribosomal protein L13 [Chloroflexota bacterium]|tara:strand:+ start:13624 stop:14076 length:453 start_codon:yes stop_codon:yes gene_type:complete